MSKKTLTDSLKNIQSIIAWFENQEEVDVEKGLEKIKEGAKLIQESRIRLREIENEFEVSKLIAICFPVISVKVDFSMETEAGKSTVNFPLDGFGKKQTPFVKYFL